jgi:V8-like Glu-specific endopeptidase
MNSSVKNANAVIAKCVLPDLSLTNLRERWSNVKKKAAGKKSISTKRVGDAGRPKAAKKKIVPATGKSNPVVKNARSGKQAATAKAARKKTATFGDFHPLFPELKGNKMGAKIGSDERKEVLAGTMKQAPFSAICKVRATFPRSDAKGNIKIGTAWFVSPKILLTAGHVVYKHSLGGRAEKLEVWSPVLRKWQPAASFACTVDWERYGENKSAMDYGAIKVLVASTDYFKLAILDDVTLANAGLTVCGYPGDKQDDPPAPPRMFGATSRGGTRRGDVLDYAVDTMPGESGAPVFTMDDGTALGVAIHNYGEENVNNTGTLITTAVRKQIESWMRSL